VAGALLEVRGVSRRFGGLKAVREVSFAVREGEIVGLIGPNGAGKTTLFSLLSGFLRPDSGEVHFDGRPTAGLSSDRLCRLGLCRTFQLVKPFGNMTVLENVMVGAFARVGQPAGAREEAARVLEFMGMGRLAKALARTLPVELRRRLEVARALATGPRLLLLDEVMAGLNPSEAKSMVALLRKVHGQGVTLLVIEHVMAVVMGLSHRILVLHHGEKIAEGTPAEVARHPRVVQAYLGEEYLIA
jgi:branched-chain amino acid transport system ATP-binding protein